MDKFVGFNLSKEHNDALIKLAGERQTATGERVDKSALLREAVAAYLAVGELDKSAPVRTILSDLEAKRITLGEAYERVSFLLAGACQTARLEALDNWTRDNDDAS